MNFVNKTGSCWVWTGGLARGGYGIFMLKSIGIGKKKFKRAHRYSWEIHFGEIPNQLLVLHKCDNPPCVNPDHLFLGTQTDNVRDLVQKGRHREQTKKFCKNGHELIAENKKKQPNGVNRCKTCLKSWARKTYLNRRNLLSLSKEVV